MPSSNLKAGAVALVTLAAGLLVVGSITTTGDAHHVAIAPQPDAGLVPGPDCLWVTALATPQALAVFHLASDAGSKYVLGHFCPQAQDGGDGPALPQGMFPISIADRQDAYDGGPIIEVWDQDSPNVPWDCACSSGSGCFVPADDGGTQPAPVGVHLSPGWSGSGCVRKACSVFASTDGTDPTWPSACPKGAP